MSLTSIANRIGCDKGTTSHEKHGYTDVYDKLIRKQSNMIEIGIDAGLSVRMWSDWSEALKLIAIDNRAECITPEIASMCDARVCDQSCDAQLLELAATIETESIDVIIDDGSHRPDDQMKTLRCLWKCLKPGGLYFVEDLHVSHWFPVADRAPQRLRVFASETSSHIQFLCSGKLAVIGKTK